MKFPHQDPIEEQLKQLKQAVDETFFKDWHVTDAMKTSLMDRIQHEQRSRLIYQKRWLPRIATGSIAVCSVLAYLLINPSDISNTNQAHFTTQLHSSNLGSNSSNITASAANLKQPQSKQDDADTRDPLLPIHHTRSISIEDDGQPYAASGITIVSRHQDKPTMNVLAYTPDTITQVQTNQKVADPNHAAVTAKAANHVSNGVISTLGLNPQSPQDTLDNEPLNNTVSGVIAAPNALVGGQLTADKLKIQQLIQLSDGDAIILGQEQNGWIDVYKLPNQAYYYGWTSDKTIGIYVLPSWKLPVQVTKSEVTLMQQSDGLHLITNYNAILIKAIPAHSPFLNMTDPMRLQLLQLAKDHQLFAIPLVDGSVDFFSSNQKGIHSTSIDSLPDSSFSFIAHIPDPTLYFYPGISPITWDGLRDQVQWLRVSTQSTTKFDASNTLLNSYPLYP